MFLKKDFNTEPLWRGYIVKNRVKEFRKQYQLTQEELAKKLGVTRQTIIAVENNKYNPTLELAMRLARYLNTTIEELFTLEEKWYFKVIIFYS